MRQKWLFALACIGMVIISMLPPITEIAYDPRKTQEVISSILSISIQPYQAWGWVFHLATLLVVLFIFWKPAKAGRVLAGYMGVNYLIIAALQTHAITAKYGFALQTGAMLGTLVIALVWLVVAIKNRLQLSLDHISPLKYVLLPLAFLVYWSPIRVDGSQISPNFDPRLILTSADYGLTYCFATPVFLFLLILFSKNYTGFAFRISAFNALLYALFNLTHWFNPNTVWMGAMHLPLLIISLGALFLTYRPLIWRGSPVSHSS